MSKIPCKNKALGHMATTAWILDFLSLFSQGSASAAN